MKKAKSRAFHNSIEEINNFRVIIKNLNDQINKDFYLTRRSINHFIGLLKIIENYGIQIIDKIYKTDNSSTSNMNKRNPKSMENLSHITLSFFEAWNKFKKTQLDLCSYPFIQPAVVYIKEHLKSCKNTLNTLINDRDQDIQNSIILMYKNKSNKLQLYDNAFINKFNKIKEKIIESLQNLREEVKTLQDRAYSEDEQHYQIDYSVIEEQHYHFSQFYTDLNGKYSIIFKPFQKYSQNEMNSMQLSCLHHIEKCMYCLHPKVKKGEEKYNPWDSDHLERWKKLINEADIKFNNLFQMLQSQTSFPLPKRRKSKLINAQNKGFEDEEIENEINDIVNTSTGLVNADDQENQNDDANNNEEEEIQRSERRRHRHSTHHHHRHSKNNSIMDSNEISNNDNINNNEDDNNNINIIIAEQTKEANVEIFEEEEEEIDNDSTTINNNNNNYNNNEETNTKEANHNNYNEEEESNANEANKNNNKEEDEENRNKNDESEENDFNNEDPVNMFNDNIEFPDNLTLNNNNDNNNNNLNDDEEEDNEKDILNRKNQVLAIRLRKCKDSLEKEKKQKELLEARIRAFNDDEETLIHLRGNNTQLNDENMQLKTRIKQLESDLLRLKSIIFVNRKDDYMNKSNTNIFVIDDELRKEYSRVDKENAAKTIEIVKLHSIIVRLEMDIQISSKVVEIKNNKLSEIEEKYNLLLQQFKAIEEENLKLRKIAERKKKFKQDFLQSELRNKELNEYLAKKDSDLLNLKLSLDKLHKMNNDLKLTQQRSGNVWNMINPNSEDSMTLEQARAKLTKISSEKVKCEEEIRLLRQELANQDNIKDLLNRQIKALQASEAALRDELNDKDIRIQELNERIEENTLQLSTVNSTKRNMQLVQEENEGLKNTNTQLKLEINRLNETAILVETLRAKLDDANERIKKKKTKIAKLKEEIVIKDSAIEQYREISRNNID